VTDPLPSRGCTVWLTGLSGAGKSTIALALHRTLVAQSLPACVLDGDRLRRGLSADLGMGPRDRSEQSRRVSHVAVELGASGIVAVVALVSPYAADRARARDAHERAGLPFLEAWVDTPLAVCAQRDPKGLYAQASSGSLSNMTGVGAPYEPPQHAELRIDGEADPTISASRILALVRAVMSDRSELTQEGSVRRPPVLGNVEAHSLGSETIPDRIASSAS